MNIKWIEINLPWRADCEYPSIPDLSNRIRQVFGTTVNEYEDKIESHRSKYLDVKMQIFDKINELYENLSNDEFDAFYDLKTKEMWQEFKDEEWFIEYRKFKEFDKQVENWLDTQPECIEYYNKIKHLEEQNKINSFCGRELNQPGTLIGLENGEIHLIGTINVLRGVCDDCTGFDSNVIIKRYAIIINMNEVKGE